jgi:hypothetical protein
MEPDSEEMRRTLEPVRRRWARVREWIMAGGAMDEVA